MDFNDFSIPIIKISQLTFQFFLSYTISESKTNSSPSLSSSQLFPSFITFVCFWLGFPIFFFVFFFFYCFVFEFVIVWTYLIVTGKELTLSNKCGF